MICNPVEGRACTPQALQPLLMQMMMVDSRTRAQTFRMDRRMAAALPRTHRSGWCCGRQGELSKWLGKRFARYAAWLFQLSALQPRKITADDADDRCMMMAIQGQNEDVAVDFESRLLIQHCSAVMFCAALLAQSTWHVDDQRLTLIFVCPCQ